jgi:uridine phosphorylase
MSIDNLRNQKNKNECKIPKKDKDLGTSEVYHLDLNKKQIMDAKIALLPGDPMRSEFIAGEIARIYSTKAVKLAWKREYCSYLAEIAGVKILITSTGIGGPSASIAIDELAKLGIRTFIRVGTTGAIQRDIKVGDVIITSGSVRLDGASTHYAPIEFPAVANHIVLNALIEAAKLLHFSYGEIGKSWNSPCYFVGITASSDTFYPGQERYDSYSGYVLRRFQGITKEWQKLNVLNYEMESSTVLTLCSALPNLMGGCVSGVVVNREIKEDISEDDSKKGENSAISVVIKAAEILVESGDLI